MVSFYPMLVRTKHKVVSISRRISDLYRLHQVLTNVRGPAHFASQRLRRSAGSPLRFRFWLSTSVSAWMFLSNVAVGVPVGVMCVWLASAGG